jgi:hypothetical protein
MVDNIKTDLKEVVRMPSRFNYEVEFSEIKRRVVPLKLIDVSEVRTASIIRAMMDVRTSETSVNFNLITWRYIPEDSKLHTRRRENVKSHIDLTSYSQPTGRDL